ncbi:MAG: hypothetical protein HC785_21200 [Calothrix sp. CSU_2_0]|nr:hypothetical protein [Calothrix sp. CSU_2_0]
MCKQIDFRWRYQPRKETDIKLMSYIQSNLIQSKTEIMLIAVRSFWLTHAIATNSENKKDVQSIARSCIKALERQAQEIVKLAELEELSWELSTQYAVNSTKNKSLENVSKSLVSNPYDDTGLSNFF